MFQYLVNFHDKKITYKMELVSSRINNKIPIGRKCYFKKDVIFAGNSSFKIVDDFIVKKSYMNIANLAASNNLFGLLKYLKFKGIRADSSGLLSAIKNNHTKMVKYLMNRKYKLIKNSKDNINDFISKAIENGNIDIIKIFYHKGYRAYQNDARIAYLKYNNDIVEYLEKKGLKLSAKEREIIDKLRFINPNIIINNKISGYDCITAFDLEYLKTKDLVSR